MQFSQRPPGQLSREPTAHDQVATPHLTTLRRDPEHFRLWPCAAATAGTRLVLPRWAHPVNSHGAEIVPGQLTL